MTKIGWTDKTWNPIVGCSRISAGCQNCYAATVSKSQKLQQFPQYQKVSNWDGTVQLVESQVTHPFLWRKANKIFVCSMSDLFHENIPDEWRDIVFGVIASNPRHTFQILTKRPANMQAYFDIDPKQLINRWIDSLEKRINIDGLIHIRNIIISNPSIQADSILSQILSHVWLGISTENQSTLDQRLPMIKSIYSSIKWLSVEPLLGLIDLKLASYPIDWVVVGGESGTRFRQMNMEWIHSVVKQCNEANIPVYVKQDSCFHPGRQGSIPDWIWKLKQFPHT